MGNVNEILKNIPQVDEVLRNEKIVNISNEYYHSIIVSSIREVQNEIRKDIINKKIVEFNEDDMFDKILYLIKEKSNPSLKKIVNATGVTLHTNLGRGLLSEKASRYVYEISKCYNNLEYDIKKGTRGLRHTHIEDLITDITGAESCMVVNNNAAATMIVLSSIAKGKEVITSRGELIEIGGSFRIPEVMMESGAILKEVGTTNKTKVSDYIDAYNIDTTCALLKVHTSNYKVFGFTEEVSLNEIVELGKKFNLPTIYDVGSGLFVDLSDIGINEPTILAIVKTGVDIAMFSGDKLLGGPQAGIIVGKKKYIDLMKKNPLARILRVDKMTIASLYATLYEYYDLEKAKKNIPTLRMLTISKSELKSKANKLKKLIEKNTKNFEVDICDIDEQVGGGSAPTVILDGVCVTIKSKWLPEKIERLLRKEEIPIIVRINHDKVCFCVRCLLDEDYNIIVNSLKNIDKIICVE